MARLLTLPSRRRLKWLFFAAWLIAIVVIGATDLPAKFEDAQKNDSSSFLPANAESTKALAAAKQIQGGELAPIVIVYRREGGLTRDDLARIKADRRELNRELPPRTSRYSQPIRSRDGQAALIEAEIRANGESETILEPVDRARAIVGDEDGLQAAVAGGAATSADAIDVFKSINSTLLLVTAAIVFVLLLIVYRSPIFWFFPLLAVAFAELASRAVGYGLTEIGVTVNGQSAAILPVLVFGAGTDYALLLVARYREELRRHDDRHEAMAVALRRAGPAIVASGLTVIAALLCLLLAEVRGTSGLGPIGATGIAVAMLAMLTALPAVLVIAGRWAFWPFIPHVGDEAADETHGAWRRIGNRIARRPRAVWAGTVVLLLVLSLGWLSINLGLTRGNAFRDDVPSVEAQQLLAKSFPAGASAPTEVIVPDPARAGAVAAALSRLDAVKSVRPGGRGRAGVLLLVTLSMDPLSTAAFDEIEPIRDVAGQAGGEGVLVGGPTAIERDLRAASARDSIVIPPIVLLVVFAILVALLRAVAAPLVLIATVILSFAAALGVGYIVFDVVFNFPGSDPSLPLFAFIFLVALGVDYNIFLMARVREETIRSGPREGVLRGLAVTGAVITSAGLVLAGTFSALAVLPLVFLTEIGFVVAFGVLLDTFIVRSVLVPALALDLGRHTWWPSALGRPGRAGSDGCGHGGTGRPRR